MKEMRVLVWCDACFEEDNEAQVEGETTMAISLNGRTRHSLDLCRRHRKELITPLMELLTAKGTPPDKIELDVRRSQPPVGAARLSDRWTCPICKDTMNRTSAVGHVWSKHHEDERPEGPTRCPECGWPEADDATAQAVSMHRYRAHQISALDEALKEAK